MRIRTADDMPVVKRYKGYRGFVEHLAFQKWSISVDWDTVGTVDAQIIRSNWICKCPFCNGAQVVNLTDPFYCVDCVMQANEFKAMAIVFPDEQRAIETILSKRPVPETRNWSNVETVDDLVRENSEHGIGV